METGITARQAGTLMQRQALSPSLLKQKEILSLLTKCSLRRGAPQNQESLAIYVQDLSSYSLEVIAPVLDKFGTDTPEEYKPLWPAVGVFLDLIRGHIRANRPSADQEAATRWLEYIAKCKAEGIEQPDAETLMRIEAMNDRFDLKKTRVIEPPAMVECPHCSKELPIASNIRLWEDDQIEQYMYDRREGRKIAERNRSMEKLPLGDVVEEVA